MSMSQQKKYKYPRDPWNTKLLGVWPPGIPEKGHHSFLKGLTWYCWWFRNPGLTILSVGYKTIDIIKPLIRG